MDDLGGPSAPDAPITPAIGDPPESDSAKISKAQEQRRRARLGRNGARVDDPTTMSGAGTAGLQGTGISIIE